MNTSTISIHTQDKKVIVVRVKREVTYTVPPAPSEKVDKALAALKSQDTDYPMLEMRRAEFKRHIREINTATDGRG